MAIWPRIVLRHLDTADPGQRRVCNASMHRPTGHPCVCGEQGPLGTPAVPPLGSSLRVRGTEYDTLTGEVRPRVIPACAGNSVEALSGFARAAGHPCVCGEQVGTVDAGNHGEVVRRVIPACAENRRD